jgi:hypothetical protein
VKTSVLFVVSLDVAILAACGTPAGAHPLDPPGTVYIDGVPCNRPCQAYMRWSRRTLEGASQVPSAPMPDAGMSPGYGQPEVDELGERARRHKFHQYGVNPTLVRRQHSSSTVQRHGPMTGRRATERSNNASFAPNLPPPIAAAPSTSTANVLDRTSTAVRIPKQAGNTPGQTVAVSNQPSASVDTPHVNRAAPSAMPNQADMNSNGEDGSGRAAPPVSPPLPSNPTLAKVEPDSQSLTAAQATAGASPKALERQIQAATDVAERFTLNAMDHVQTTKQTTSQDPTSYQSDSDDKFRLVALVLARGDVKSAADLAGKDIAIDGRHLGSNHDIQAALVAAGALKIRTLDEGDRVIHQLVEGQVPAAVLTLVSREAVGVFPTIPGFRLLTIPLPPRSE